MSTPDTAAVRPGSMTPDQRRLLERLLAEQGTGPAPRPRIRPDAVDRTHAEPSSAQRRIWFFDRLQPGSALYTITGVAELRGTVDREVLTRCLTEVVRRHETLRTTFHGDGDEPYTRVEPATPVPVEFTDLSALTETGRDHAVRERLDAEARRPFDLSADLMLRAGLLRLAPGLHLLQLSMHHIAADGWSLGVLLRELGMLYPAFSRGEPSPLPEPAVQYADYAAWLNARMREPGHEQALRSWADGLQGASALDLPTDRPRRESGSFVGGQVPLTLPAALMARIKRLADQERATPYMVLVAALTTLLGRWSGGREDVVLGCAVAGRNRSEIEPLIGFFVNTLPLRLDLGGRPTFRTLVGRARTACLDGYAGQDVPFEQIVERLQPDREPGARVPLVRHMLVLHNSPRPRLDLPGLDIEVLPLDTGTAKFEIQIELTPTEDGGLGGWLEYATDLFDEATATRLTEGLLTLLDDGVARPDAPADELRMLSGTDRHTLLTRWSGAATAPAGSGLLHHLIEDAVDRTPEAVALVHGTHTTTYAELDERANRLAHDLIARGVRVDDVVGVQLPRSAEAVTAMLAVLKAGAAYLPLDPAHPPRRLAELARDAGARLVLTEGDGDPSAPATRPAVAVPSSAGAYVLYTSGSTGRPKGVTNEHAAVVNRILWMQQAYGLEPGEAVLHKTPLGFDVSGWEWLWPLAAGARIVVAGDDGRRDPRVIARLIREHAVTTCHFVPSMLRAFLDGPAADCAGVLRRVVCSGEELPPATARRFASTLPGTRLYNLYGPTEAAIDVTAWEVPRSLTPEHRTRLPIGTPIAGARLHVLDAHLEPVPPGAVGELFIGGLPLARGYRGRPGLTADRFLPDPFTPGGRLYRTGDRARWAPDGSLDYLGRADHQLKIRGQRIEPGEIEAVLGAHPAVEQAVVLPFRDAEGDLQLAAYAGLGPDDRSTPEPEENGDHVDRWRTVFDDTYQASHPSAETVDLAGWNDSATGEPIAEEEMRVWVEETVERITALRPSRVLEIGCGTGQFLLRLAPHCARYVGTEISPEALTRLAAQLGPDTTAELSLRSGDDFTGFAEGEFDTIILNSVVQYFPDVDYLLRVLRAALAHLAPGGHLFVGDVRDLRLVEAFHCSVQAARLPEHTPAADLRRLVDQQIAQEEELLVHPALFETLAPAARVRLLAKSSPHRNELTRFRYDAVITAPGGLSAPAVPDAWHPWTPGPSETSGTSTASGTSGTSTAPGRDGSYGLLGLPDARLGEDLARVRLLREGAAQTVGALRRALTEADPRPAGEPADQPVPDGYTLLPRLGAEPGLLDLEFRTGNRPAGGRAPQPAPADGAFANDPRRAIRARLTVAGLREHLQRALPDYMVPASLTVVDRWPIGPNGKLDRAALPAPTSLRPALATGYVAPRDDTERIITRMWQGALGLDRIGVHDDFFSLGGHSLLAVQIVGRIQDAFDCELPLGVLLRAPTIAAVGEWLSENSGNRAPRLAPIARTARRHRTPAPEPAPVPASPAEQGARP
ncbi:non-ribosomal peptide synthetase [Streptomyces sp. CL7]|uniref:non-ribosomal peptide synthetase n=1 Tax=Streptomyces sp. CL7 TaxID=3096006 RepID=UPI002A74C239|nr:non-ribosomal peptide synthetase [Streptomyces sp. CL7]WPP34309.1 amino acid adenylation domain-containing protein [Streptomyces sp. CL7]